MIVLAKPTLAQAFRRGAVRATWAPSVHNTQPWRFVLGSDSLEIHSDERRRLRVLDPTGRQMLISCGCALFNARVSLAAAGLQVTVERHPDPSRPENLARLTAVAESTSAGQIEPGSAGSSGIGLLDSMIELRRANRSRFAAEEVPPHVIDDLMAAAEAEGAQLVPIVRAQDKATIALASQRADVAESLDPAYRSELGAWTSDDPGRDDGAPAMVDAQGEAHAAENQCLLLLGTGADSPEAWLRAGEALEHLLLEVTRKGYAASPHTQVIELPNTRAMLREELKLSMQPHVLLRVGRAPGTPATRRRRLVDMLVDAG